METFRRKWAIIPYAFLQTAALTTNLYIVPQLLIDKLCNENFNYTVCSNLGKSKLLTQENHVFQMAAGWNALITFTGLFPAAIITLPLGALTDLVPKHKVLYIPAIACLVTCLINLLSSVFMQLHVGLFTLSNFATGVFGGESGFLMLSCTYAACACSDARTLPMTMVVAAVHIGDAIGNLVTNYLTRYYGYSSAFIFATVSSIINLLYALVLIPPIDFVNEKSSSQGKKYGLWTGIKERTKDAWLHLASFTKRYIFYPKDSTVLLLFTAALFELAAGDGEHALITLFLKHSPLNFKADQIGIYLTLSQFSKGFYIAILVFASSRCCMLSDYSLMIMGSLSKILNYMVLSLSTTTQMVYISTVLICFGSSVTPAVRSKVTALVPNEDYGVSLSFIGLLGSASDAIMSPAANGLFAATVKIYNGFSILCLSFLCMLSLGIFSYTFLTKDRIGKTEECEHTSLTKADSNE